MDLKDFVAESQIIEGVRSAQEHTAGSAAEVVPRISHVDPPLPPTLVAVRGMGVNRQFFQNVEFDVALAASENVQTKVGAGLLTVVSVGGGRESTASQETTSRIRFTVPLVLPLQPSMQRRPALHQGQPVPATRH
jgi:hypothetical protein